MDRETIKMLSQHYHISKYYFKIKGIPKFLEHDGNICFKYDKKEVNELYHIFTACIRNSAKKGKKNSDTTHLIFLFCKNL